LSIYPNSEIIGELNRINAVLQDFITDIKAQDLRRTEQSVRQSVLLVREKYEADKVFLSIWTIVVLSGYFSASRNSFRIKSESSSIVIIIWRMYPTNGEKLRTGVLRRLLNISAP
jgi:hypothetical protein